MPELYPRDQLRAMVERYGVVIINDKKLCKNLLNDLTPEHRLEIHLLIEALDQGIVEQLLLKPPSLSVALQMNRLAQSLHDNTGIELTLAYWAIESWALALNVIVEPLVKPTLAEVFDFDEEDPFKPVVKKAKFKIIFFILCGLSVLIFGSMALQFKPKKDPITIEPPLQLEKPAAQTDGLPVPKIVEQPEDAWTQNRKGDKYFYDANYKTAAAWYEKAALQGDITAQCNMGYMYAQGLGVPKDYEKAVYWYQKAADQGSPEGQNSLGIMYEYGYGVAKDKAQAIVWYSKAVEQGHYGAQQRLGNLMKN